MLLLLKGVTVMRDQRGTTVLSQAPLPHLRSPPPPDPSLSELLDISSTWVCILTSNL